MTQLTPRTWTGTELDGVSGISEERSQQRFAHGTDQCPRCGERLHTNYDELLCVICGYVDYSYVSPRQSNGVAASPANDDCARYVGGFPMLTDTVINVKLQQINGIIELTASCPFCKESRTALLDHRKSGRVNGAQVWHYQCLVGHTMSLMATAKGTLVWK